MQKEDRKHRQTGKYIRVAFSVGEKTFANNAFEQGFLKLKQ